MTIRDKGPMFTLPGGVNSRSTLGLDPAEQEGPNPESGIIAKALHHHPVMRFFGVAAATMVGMHFGGKIIREGGIRAFAKAEEHEVKWVTNNVKNFRDLQHTLDKLQGVDRVFAQGRDRTYETADKLFVRKGGRIVGDKAEEKAGFWFTAGEKEAKSAMGLEGPTEWTIRDQLQQSLVRQARRLPYELPAAYFVQRGLTDRLFGSEDNFKGKWYNPVDVVSDFVRTSVKNTATMMLPFEAAGASMGHAWRKFMTYGDDFTNLRPSQVRMAEHSIVLKDVLQRVGHDASDLINRGVKLSAQTSGAISTGLQEARNSSYSLTEYLHDTRHGMKQLGAKYNASKLGKVLGRYSTETLDNNPYKVFDLAPGPFRGSGTAFKAGADRYREIGLGFDAFDELMTRGKKGFDAWVQGHSNPAAVIKAFEGHLDFNSTKVGELASSLSHLGGKQFSGSAFFHARMQDEYSNILKRRLLREGMSDSAVDQFTTAFKVTSPRGQEADIAGRILFGGKKLNTASHNDLFTELERRLSHNADDVAAGVLQSKLPKAIQDADAIFTNRVWKAGTEKKIRDSWNLTQEKVVAAHGESVLKKIKPDYQDFDVHNITDEQLRFLKRRTAQMTGLRQVDKHGKVIDEHFVNQHLQNHGFDPDDVVTLKAYLTTKGGINKPWQQGGRNIFGYAPLTINEGVNRGYFQGIGNEQRIADLSETLSRNDPIGLGNYAIGGVYKSSSGRVVDFNRIKRGFTRFGDRVSHETQVPLLHFSPLEALGATARQDARERSLIQYISGASDQKFLGRARGQDDYYMWVKGGGRGGRGRVYAFGKYEGGHGFEELPGFYKPASARASNILSKHARIAGGDLGRVPAPRREPNKDGWLYRTMGADRYAKADRYAGRARKLFKVSDDQPDSVFRAISRFRGRNADIRNPRVMAQLLRDGKIANKAGDLELINGQVMQGNTVVRTAQEFADAFQDNFSTALRRKGFSSKIQGILEKDSKFDRLFSIPVEDTYNTGTTKTLISELQTPGQTIRGIQKLIDDDATLINSLDPEMAKPIRSAQNNLLKRHINASSSNEYWERPLPGGERSSSIHTRLDEVKADIIKYQAIKYGVTDQAGFSTVVEDMMSELGKMRAAGRITQAEVTEARAAILSTQINLNSFIGHDIKVSPLENVLNVVDSLRHGTSMKDAFDDIVNGRLGMSNTRFGKLTPPLRRKFGMARYEYEGSQYNPFGDTDTVLLPTFGTTFQRNPGRAIGSVLGWNTWKDPDAFSGASVPLSHVVERLNKYQSTFGLGFDATAFKGPLDMYARGMVGMRALPLVAGGVAAIAADRTLGGYLNEKDENGDRVYSPYILGKLARPVAELQALGGLAPGGMSYSEKRKQIFEGEVPIRAGRYWPLGSTEFKGGRIQYFRPSWYRRLNAGHLYTDQTFGSPLERLAFGYDFSPLRPLDPYRFEREHAEDRPYPVTGDYFTGPWGPITPLLNATIGKVLKPRKMMHEDALNAGLAAYQPVGESGAYMPSMAMPSYAFAGSSGTTFTGVAGEPGIGVSSGSYGQSGVRASNLNIAAAGKTSPQRASGMVTSDIADVNTGYASAAGNYGIATQRFGRSALMRPRVLAASEPINPAETSFQLGEFGYRVQELAGIYGFGLGVAREALGFGERDFTPEKPVLASASAAYSTTRSFWDLNLGGLGDMPSPMEGSYSNIELSEVVRRFIPKDRAGIQTVNPIPNKLGVENPWLPSSDYYLNFKTGDPFSLIQEGEMRLPGKGYERFNRVHPDTSGRYGLIDQYKILGDVAPWSPEFKQISNLINSAPLDAEERDIVATTAEQVRQKAIGVEFTPYKYRYESLGQRVADPVGFGIGRGIEWLSHRDTYFNSKFMRNRTAVEDWERSHVYGSSFPEWQDPIKDFVEPIAYKASQRDPLSATLAVGVTGALFGRSPAAKTVGSIVGGLIGFGASAYGHIYEKMTGQRYMPAERRKELAVDEYADILEYTKNMRLMKQAESQHDAFSANAYRKAAQQTMYGADVYNGNLAQITQAMPKRKREHFQAMLTAPEEEREAILSTAGRLERRIFEAAWGQEVEARPDLEEYFQEHELPAEDWEGWHPNTNMDDIKIKIAQAQGIDLSEMGYYPQQIREANLINPSYPNFSAQSGRRNTIQRLRRLMEEQGVHGDVTPVYTPYAGTRVNFQAGLLSGV